MTLKTWTKIAPPSLEFQEDRIHASEFGDSYFQPIKAGSDQSHRATTVEDEIHYTFFGGNDLAKQFETHANQQFCIAELGLSGANLSETLRFWQSCRRLQPGWTIWRLRRARFLARKWRRPRLFNGLICRV